MELSTASAVWNTRKGVAIALRESGGTEAAAALDEEMEKLVPVLYRYYTFDPIFPLPAFLVPSFLLTPRPYYQVHVRPQPADLGGDEGGVDRARPRP